MRKEGNREGERAFGERGDDRVARRDKHITVASGNVVFSWAVHWWWACTKKGVVDMFEGKGGGGVSSRRRGSIPRRAAGFLRPGFTLAFLLAFLPGVSVAQIGGATGAMGTFLLEDVEDLDLYADSVGRDWVASYVNYYGDVLSAVGFSGSGLTLATDQSPVGYLRANVPERFGYISANFGVPMPAVVGDSTLDSPGDITSFGQLRFLACFAPEQNNLGFTVTLETYPETSPGVYPVIYWGFTPAVGSTFQEVTVDLRSPDQIENQGLLSLEDLLSQTRYLSFNIYAGPVASNQRVELRVDDVRLEPAAAASVDAWWLYR